jgi:non-specific serine/threonine protein kinase
MALGLLALLERDIGQARERFENALTTFTDLGDMYWVAFAERLLGGIDRFEGNDEAAEKRYRASLSVAQQHGILIMIASTLYAFADLAVRRGQPERALRLVGASAVIRERVGEALAMEKEMVGDVAGAARALLDAATSDRLYQEGRAMEPDDAVAYALKSPE